jgi:hypothetical protein
MDSEVMRERPVKISGKIEPINWNESMTRFFKENVKIETTAIPPPEVSE